MARKKVIHINQYRLRDNIVADRCEPAVTFKFKSGGKATAAHQASIRDASGRELARIVCSPKKPLSCGARAWVETDLNIVPLDEDGNEIGPGIRDNVYNAAATDEIPVVRRRRRTAKSAYDTTILCTIHEGTHVTEIRTRRRR